jgi:RimJ/RimL family protein N-acetyltransferase
MQTNFSSNGISIRTFRPDDAPALYEAVRESVPELSCWLPWCRPDYDQANALQFIGTREPAWFKSEEYSFVIVESTSGRLLGGTGINHVEPEHKFANLGYWVRTSDTRKGVASTAIQLTGRFAFGELGLHHIQILAAADNIPSQRAAGKAGARREALLRHRLMIHGTPHDAVLFSLVAADLPARPPGSIA